MRAPMALYMFILLGISTSILSAFLTFLVIFQGWSLTVDSPQREKTHVTAWVKYSVQFLHIHSKPKGVFSELSSYLEGDMLPSHALLNRPKQTLHVTARFVDADSQHGTRSQNPGAPAVNKSVAHLSRARCVRERVFLDERRCFSRESRCCDLLVTLG